MNPQQIKYFAIIVHYEDAATTTRAIKSLKACDQAPDKIIVIDNGDHPYSSPPQGILCLRPSQNSGYAAGINTGLGALMTQGVISTDVVICFNNDIIARPDMMTNLRQWWQRQNPGLALINLATVSYNNQVTLGANLNLVTGRTSFASSSQAYSRPYHVPVLHGAAFAATYATFASLQGVPESYFMYWEDTALSLHAQKNNIPTLSAPTVQVLHDNDKHSLPSGDKLYYLVRNGAICLSRHTPRLWSWYWKILNLVRLMCHLIVPNKPTVRTALLDAIYYRRQGKRPLSKAS